MVRVKTDFDSLKSIMTDSISLTSLALFSSCAVGVLFAFAMYIREFFRPIEELADKSNVFQNAMASSERIFAVRCFRSVSAKLA